MPLEVHTEMPKSAHSHTVIFLHGRDSNASEFAEELFESQASDDRTSLEIFPAIKWVFPSSDIRTSQRFGGELSQWFDIWSVEDPDERSGLQTAGLSETVASILEIIDKEALEVPLDHIILAGISQGCATALYALLSNIGHNNKNMRLGGFIGLCGWKTPQLARDMDIGPDTLSIPIFLSHSGDDEVVPVANGERLKEYLENLNMSVEWHRYEDGGHWINEPKGVDDIVAFISRIIR